MQLRRISDEASHPTQGTVDSDADFCRNSISRSSLYLSYALKQIFKSSASGDGDRFADESKNRVI
jgi:hypothetical protein